MSKTIYPPAVANLIDEFRNEALCRHDTNQMRARKIWIELGPMLSGYEKQMIGTEWSHYLTNELNTDQFGDFLNKLATKYRTI